MNQTHNMLDQIKQLHEENNQNPDYFNIDYSNQERVITHKEYNAILNRLKNIEQAIERLTTKVY